MKSHKSPGMVHDANTEDGARRRIDELVAQALSGDHRELSLPAPEPGSSIDLDDAEFALLATSHAVRSGIIAAREHLLSAALLWRSHEGGTLLPTAYSTLMRAAMVGAGTSLWILNPAERLTRIQRTTEFAVDNFRKSLTVEKEALEAAPRLGIASPDLVNGQERNVQRVASHLRAACEAQWIAYGNEGPCVEKKLPRYNQTSVIADAAAFAYRPDLKMPVYSQLLWRIASGDAHALQWQKVLRALVTGEHEVALRKKGETLELRDVNTCVSLFPLLAQGALLTEKAERLYEARRVCHAPC